MITQERYINPYTDFGFKKLFGTEMNKDLLISFLNSLFNGHEVIRDVEYLNSERLGEGYTDRKAVFDVYCENEKGEKFIVEMQKAEQNYFMDRSVFYSTFPIREQAKRGENWDFELKSVYLVGVLDFVFPEDEYSAECFHHEIKLMDTQNKHIFYDKLTFVYLEMPKFSKTEDELVTMFDKWMFALKNLSRLLERPKALQDRIFKKFFEQAEIARFTPEERQDYEYSVKIYRDLINVVNTANSKGWRAGHVEGIAEGRAEGLAEGRAEGLAESKVVIARNLKGMGMSVADIMKATGLTAQEIENI